MTGYFAPKNSKPPTTTAFKLVNTEATKKIGSHPFATSGNSPNASSFRKLYDRGDFPILVSHIAKGIKLSWKADVEKLDYQHYLPLFFTGLTESEEPYASLAMQGIHEMLDKGKYYIM